MHGCQDITIDLDAYERLSRMKKRGQSFSQVIKELVPEAGATAREFLDALDATEVSEGTLETVEAVIAQRRDSPVRVPRW